MKRNWMLLLALMVLSVAAYAQDSAAGPENGGLADMNQTTGTVPRLIRFSGVVTDASGKAVPAPVGLSFSLYEAQEGGSALWTETQQVQPDGQGHYTVLLGATSPGGLPLDLFTTGAARWLGVQPALSGAGEQPRVLLVGVPYALKAADADTLGGKPSSAYVTTVGQSAGSATESAAVASQVVSQAMAAGAAVGQAQNQPAPLTVGGTGTTNYIPIWTNSTTLGNSALFQTGPLKRARSLPLGSIQRRCHSASSAK